MPTIKISEDAVFAFFEDDDPFPFGAQVEIELTDQEVAWIRNAEKRFWGAQAFLTQKYREASR